MTDQYIGTERADFEAEVVGAEKYVHLINWRAAEASGDGLVP